MQKFFILFLLSALISVAHAGRKHIEDTDNLFKDLNLEVEKDLAGEKSCFKGAVKKKMEEMHENYGGRFGGSYNLEVLKIMDTQYRYLAKYCDHYLDRDLNILPDHADDSLRAYRQCTHTNESLSIAGVIFESTTSGTFEREGLIFKVRYDVTNSLIVNHDAGYHVEDSEIKSWNTTIEMECALVD